MDKIVQRYQFLLDTTGTDFLRYPHEAIDWRARMIAIVGARGVGKTTLLLQLNADTKGIRGLGKVDKLYLGNTNLAYLFGRDHTDIGNVRETFFVNQVGMAGEVTASSKSDFVVNGKYTFEVGGRSKGHSQIEGLENAYIVKDDIEYGAENTIPLWHFGFLY